MTSPRPRLLIADDHGHVAAGLSALLAPDYEVVGVVGDGDRVLETVTAQHPDLLLLDLWLPGRNGLDLLHDLREGHPGLMVVVLTMHADIVVAVEAMNRGARGFVLKDSGYDELHAALKQVLGGHPYLSPRVTGESATTIFRDPGRF
jgi:DNA-binding NarL/FixJ family response regulator